MLLFEAFQVKDVSLGSDVSIIVDLGAYLNNLRLIF